MASFLNIASLLSLKAVCGLRPPRATFTRWPTCLFTLQLHWSKFATLRTRVRPPQNSFFSPLARNLYDPAFTVTPLLGASDCASYATAMRALRSRHHTSSSTCIVGGFRANPVQETSNIGVLGIRIDIFKLCATHPTIICSAV